MRWPTTTTSVHSSAGLRRRSASPSPMAATRQWPVHCRTGLDARTPVCRQLLAAVVPPEAAAPAPRAPTPALRAFTPPVRAPAVVDSHHRVARGNGIAVNRRQGCGRQCLRHEQGTKRQRARNDDPPTDHVLLHRCLLSWRDPLHFAPARLNACRMVRLLGVHPADSQSPLSDHTAARKRCHLGSFWHDHPSRRAVTTAARAVAAGVRHLSPAAVPLAARQSPTGGGRTRSP